MAFNVTLGILWATGAAVAMGAFLFSLKLVDRLDPSAAALFIRGASLVTALFLVVYFWSRGALAGNQFDSPLVWYAVAGGAVIVLADIFLIKSFQHLPVDYVGTTIMIGGGLLIAVLCNVFFLGESVTALKLLGMTLVLTGILLVSLF